MTLKEIIHSDPEIMGGTPVFVGTRVPVRILLDYLEGINGRIRLFESELRNLRRERHRLHPRERATVAVGCGR